MTNLEYIKSLTKEELAKFLCKLVDDCEGCIVKENCFYRHNGFCAWLDKERTTDD